MRDTTPQRKAWIDALRITHEMRIEAKAAEIKSDRLKAEWEAAKRDAKAEVQVDLFRPLALSA